MTKKIKCFIFASYLVVQLTTQALGYCFYNQTGSDLGTIYVFIYDNTDHIKSKIGNREIKLPLTYVHVNSSKFSSWNHKALHVLKPGEHACWNWKDTGRETMYYVIIGEKYYTIPWLSTGELRLYINEFNTHNGLCYCNKLGTDKVVINDTDPRCGTTP